MKTYKTRQGQSLLDVSLQLFGDTENILTILKNNPTLNINDDLQAGTEIQYNEIDNVFVRFVNTKNIDVNTSESNLGGAFNEGFNEGFNI